MGKWDVGFFIYQGSGPGGVNWELTLAEVQKMVQRMELVKDIAVGHNDVVESIKRTLVVLRHKRQLLEPLKEHSWVHDMLLYLNVVISDLDFVVSDLHTDINTLTDGFVPNPYHFNRRGKTNIREEKTDAA
jgi:hypothetical protein